MVQLTPNNDFSNPLTNDKFSSVETYAQMFGSRLLDQRARISFHYNGANSNGEETIIFLPFYENPEITEGQSANYSDYSLIGRAGSLYSYLGSGSRKFKVTTTYTLPHLAMHEMGVDRFMRIFKNSGKESEKALFTHSSNHSAKSKKGDANNSLSLAVEKAYWSLRGQATDNVFDNSNLKDIQGQARDILEGSSPNEMNKIIDTLLLFIAILRTSVVNNVNNPMYGPPLLRLTFGTLYQSVPCICKSYNISWEEESGYHLETLTPRRLMVTLNLEEIRVGDFGSYEPAIFQKRDNLTGWESAVNSPHTTDSLPQAGFWAGSK